MFKSTNLLILNSITFMVLNTETTVAIHFSIILLVLCNITLLILCSITLLVWHRAEDRENVWSTWDRHGRSRGSGGHLLRLFRAEPA
jgi:hypothetical protein